MWFLEVNVPTTPQGHLWMINREGGIQQGGIPAAVGKRRKTIFFAPAPDLNSSN